MIMKFTFRLPAIAFFISLILLIASCKKEVSNPSEYADSMEKLVVSKGFNWKTTKDIDVTISVTGTKDYQAKSKVSVFNADPSQGGQMMLSGNIAPGSSFVAKMRIPASMTPRFT